MTITLEHIHMKPELRKERAEEAGNFVEENLKEEQYLRTKYRG